MSAARVSAMTRPATETTTRSLVGSMAIGWSGPGIFLVLAFITVKPRENSCALSTSADHHLADLNHRRQIGIVRDVAHDLLGMRSEAALKGVDRIAVDVAHANVRCGGARSAARQTLVDSVEFAVIAHAALHQRHVLVAVVLMIEFSAGRIGVHHAHLDHWPSP